MRCPFCDVPMKEVERRGVLIDVCPECRGVWLDRGELEKLLATNPDHVENPPPQQYHHHKKRRNFLEEIFDFDFFD
ncbi:zf-TFIIB domain-containing protein [Thermanaeromonas sp.]|uniref:TFIIB-type zinc ribbon-containing protein n=1 Tax=Thermanaeromonas sp. TaxID=2003697 RepID=UPI00342A9D6B